VYSGEFESDRIHLILYVDDDLILATSKKVLTRVLNELKSNFEITEGNVDVYVGIEMIRDRKAKSIFIHQSSYVKTILERFNMIDAKTKESPDLGISLASTGGH